MSKECLQYKTSDNTTTIKLQQDSLRIKAKQSFLKNYHLLNTAI